MLSPKRPPEAAKSRRYSRASAFNHWMDNIKDRKFLKMHMKQLGDNNGTFTLVYVDEFADEFFNVKTNFTYVGTYQIARENESREIFGVVLPVDSRGVIDLKDSSYREKDPDIGHMLSTERIADSTGAGMNKELSINAQDRSKTSSNVQFAKFFTEKLTCTITENNSTQVWVITPSTNPDCMEKTPREIQQKVSWLWTGENMLKVAHTAPPGALDFVGEECFEPKGSSSVDLRFRFPLLVTSQNPAVVALSEMGGWKLGKQSMF